MKEVHKVNKDVKIAIISGVFIVIAAIIGVFTYNIDFSNKSILNEYYDLMDDYTKLLDAYDNLQKTYDDLENKYAPLEEQNVLLTEENTSLQSKISELENELEVLKDNLSNQQNNDEITEAISEVSNTNSNSGKKVSIFALDTFQGRDGWEVPTYEYWYTDTYGNEYVTAHFASHYSTTKEDGYYIPTYLLDKKYSICEGEIAWSKYCKDYSGSAWIDFYSGDDLIYSTEPITATDRAITFSFSVEGLETLTIVRNGTRNHNVGTSPAYIIYPYLNLIE